MAEVKIYRIQYTPSIFFFFGPFTESGDYTLLGGVSKGFTFFNRFKIGPMGVRGASHVAAIQHYDTNPTWEEIGWQEVPEEILDAPYWKNEPLMLELQSRNRGQWLVAEVGADFDDAAANSGLLSGAKKTRDEIEQSLSGRPFFIFLLLVAITGLWFAKHNGYI